MTAASGDPGQRQQNEGEIRGEAAPSVEPPSFDTPSVEPTSFDPPVEQTSGYDPVVSEPVAYPAYETPVYPDYPAYGTPPDPAYGTPPVWSAPPETGFPPPGFPPPGSAGPGFPPPGFPPPGSGGPGFPPPGFPPPGAPQQGYPPAPPYGAGYPPGPMGHPGYPGYPGYPMPAPMPTGTNSLAITALVCSILGLAPFCGFLFSIVGIVSGAVGIGQIRRTGQSGYGLAITGIVIGVVTLLVWMVGLTFAWA